MQFIPTAGWTACFPDGTFRPVMAWVFDVPTSGPPVGDPMVLERGRLVMAGGFGPYTLSEDAKDKVPGVINNVAVPQETE